MAELRQDSISYTAKPLISFPHTTTATAAAAAAATVTTPNTSVSGSAFPVYEPSVLEDTPVAGFARSLPHWPMPGESAIIGTGRTTSTAATSQPEPRITQSTLAMISNCCKAMGTADKALAERRLDTWCDALEEVIAAADDSATALRGITAWLRLSVSSSLIDVRGRHSHLALAPPQHWLVQLRSLLPPVQANYVSLFNARYTTGQSQAFFSALRRALPSEHYSDHLYRAAIIHGLPTEVRIFLSSKFAKLEDASAGDLETALRAYEQLIAIPPNTVHTSRVAAVQSVPDRVEDQSDEEYDPDGSSVLAAGIAALSTAKPLASTTNLNAQPTSAAAASALASLLQQRINELAHAHRLCLRCFAQGHRRDRCPLTRRPPPPAAPATPTSSSTPVSGNVPAGGAPLLH